MKPMLSATLSSEKDYQKLRYPLLGSPKLDGIRMLVLPDKGPVTRSLDI